MKDIPIIFSAPMVKAWLTGNKTQTRRLAWRPSKRAIGVLTDPKDREAKPTPWQKVKPGDRLWVRENLIYDWKASCWRYRADDVSVLGTVGRRELPRPTPDRWPLGVCNSIHMPREFSRLTLIVTAVNIERLQDISKADVIAEGITERDGLPIADVHAGWHEPFAQLWDSLHGPDAWDANPWVVAISATAFKANIDTLGKVAA